MPSWSSQITRGYLMTVQALFFGDGGDREPGALPADRADLRGVVIGPVHPDDECPGAAAFATSRRHRRGIVGVARAAGFWLIRTGLGSRTRRHLHEQASPQGRKAMYIGIGTVVLIVIIVLVILMLRRR